MQGEPVIRVEIGEGDVKDKRDPMRSDLQPGAVNGPRARAALRLTTCGCDRFGAEPIASAGRD